VPGPTELSGEGRTDPTATHDHDVHARAPLLVGLTRRYICLTRRKHGHWRLETYNVIGVAIARTGPFRPGEISFGHPLRRRMTGIVT